MAMIDYGSIVKKNGVIIQKDMFMDMKEAVGFTIEELEYSYTTNQYDEDYNVIGQKQCTETIKINGDYFSYIGDKELLICIYKGALVFISNNRIIKIQRDLWLDYEIPYELQKLEFNINNIDFKIKRLAKDENRYKLRFIYKGDIYEVLYGYGVDVNKDSWYYSSKREKRYVNNWFKKSY